MPKIKDRPYSPYTRDALQLFGQLIREARIVKKLSTSELAERIGISRALLQRIEKGNPGCSIGVVFEAAAICGVTLFELDQRSLARSLAHQSTKLALLPQSVRVSKLVVKDAFWWSYSENEKSWVGWVFVNWPRLWDESEYESCPVYGVD